MAGWQLLLGGLLGMLLAGLLPSAPVAAEPLPSPEAVTAEAEQDFREMLTLWRDRRYERLYDRVIPGSHYSRNYFVELLEYSGRRPACCWEQLQDVSTTYVDREHVTLTARLGLEVEGVGTRFVTRSFALVKEEGRWKIPAHDIITLAEPNWQRIPNRWPVKGIGD